MQVESDSSKDALEKCSSSLSQSQKETRTLRSQLTSLEAKYREVELRLAETTQQVGSIHYLTCQSKCLCVEYICRKITSIHRCNNNNNTKIDVARFSA